MKRQNFRKLVLIISMLLFPVTIWYMSPYLIIRGGYGRDCNREFYCLCMYATWVCLFWKIVL